MTSLIDSTSIVNLLHKNVVYWKERALLPRSVQAWTFKLFIKAAVIFALWVWFKPTTWDIFLFSRLIRPSGRQPEMRQDDPENICD